MNCPCNTTEPLPKLRAILLGALAAAMAALLTAAPVGAEPVEGTAVPSAEEASAEPESSAAAATPLPVAAVPESVSAVEAPSAASAVPAVVSTAPVDRALPDTPASADSVTEAATKVEEEVGGVTKDVPPAPVRRPAELLGSAVRKGDEATTTGAPSAGGAHPAASTPEPANVGRAPTRSETAPELLPGEPTRVKAAAGSGAEKARLSLAPDGESAHMFAADTAAAVAQADTTRGGQSTDGHAPADLPPSTPESPASAAPGSGGPSFLPLAALLALLALAAPATLRRLGSAPGLRVPTWFACALERPG